MVWGIFFNGYIDLALFRNSKASCKNQKPVIILNTIIFSVLAIFSLYVFFKLGKVKASGKQLNRNNRINRFGNRDIDKSTIIEGESKEIKDEKDD